ncbi:MAG: S24 family peptidase [Bryobacteraceae bacterium]
MLSAAAIPTQMGEYLLLQVALPGRPPENAGILLLDRSSNRLYLRFRRDLAEITEDEDDLEVLAEIASDLESKASELGAAKVLEWLEDTVSNVLRVSDRESMLVENFDAAADRLYRRHIRAKVLPFRTHLPKYTLRAAAGKFGEHMEVEPEDWEEVPEQLRMSEDMFIAHVVGRSMEPRIPDGSLCVFRHKVTGSRQGKLVLVENYGETGENRYTIKRYKSVKAQDEEGWRHEKIILEPLNPEYEAWELEENSPIKVIGEFVCVLPTP